MLDCLLNILFEKWLLIENFQAKFSANNEKINSIYRVKEYFI